MSVESSSSIQKVDSGDSIVACQQDAADFFDSIDPSLPCAAQSFRSANDGSSVLIAKFASVFGLPQANFAV